MLSIVLAVVSLLQITPAQAERLRWVPNPRAANSTWVADPSGHLKPATVDSLNALADALSREAGHEIAVVAIDSTSGFEPFDVALALHRMWGVGQRGRDNGIVLLWVPTQRAVHISVGYGLEGVLPDARAGRIRDQVIFPAFRRGDFDAGMLAGVSALAAAAREETDPRGSTMSTTDRPPDDRRAVVEREEGSGRGRRTTLIFGAIGGALTLAGGGVAAARYRRRRPRPCPRGHGMMVRLDERADNEHLDRGERLEERLESVDYDVWICPACDYALKVPHRAWFSSYENCPSCKRRTLDTTHRTIVAATTSRAGQREVIERCRNCEWTRSHMETIPRIQTSSGSSSGGSSFGGGRSGGGGSFGGGSAGGGGAGGRY
ncbi:MAG TPA: TPM domain-containing protein [Gemmatimonadaceae bacterium]|nr:TPM domain-containing protein [Gemmatimonadaceae bacterium]